MISWIFHINQFCLSACLAILLYSCDYISPQTKFTLAVPDKNFSYVTSARHLKELLESDGYKVDIIYTKTAIEANELVATGGADLSFIMNHSHFMSAVLSSNSKNLRTILPLYNQLLFLYTKDAQLVFTMNNFRKKKIKVEVLNGEDHLSFKQMIGDLIDSVQFTDGNDADIKYFWGTYHGRRAQKYDSEGLNSMDLSDGWIQYLTTNNSSLKSFNLHGIPELNERELIKTVETQTLLVASTRLGEKAAYHLVELIYNNRLKLLSFEKKYGVLNEIIDDKLFLYPLHKGADLYLRRDEPTLLMRYSETIAMILTLGVIIFGGLQALRNHIKSRKKNQFSLYFNDLISIKEKSASLDKVSQEKQFESLYNKLLDQMVNGKLEKNDFHLFARLLQQEITNSRLKRDV